MQSFIINLLACSVAMSVLALLYMAATPFLTKRYSEKGCYYAWMIFVIGLIIPFRPQWDNAIVTVDMPSDTTIPLSVPSINAATSPITQNISWRQIAAAVWLAGVIVFLVYHLIKHYRFVKTARRWSENITDEQVLTLFQRLKSEMGLTKHIDLYVCSCVGGPMMIGVIKPRIFLPTAELTHDELSFILKHELVHYKRKDLLYKYLVLAATAMHWFNPVVYLMAKAIDVLREMSCDAEVVRSADRYTRQRYSEMIIGVVKFQSKLRTALSTNFYGGKRGMKNRISSIMDSRKKKAGFVIASLILLLTMATGVTFAETQAAANTTEYFDLEEGTWWFQEELRRIFAEAEEAIKSSNVKVFSVYEQYGLTYNRETDRLYYNGRLVRYFEDNQATDGIFMGTVKPGVDGNIDVHAVRNSTGKLTGVALYNQADFDARTLIIRNQNGNVGVLGGTGNASPSVKP